MNLPKLGNINIGIYKFKVKVIIDKDKCIKPQLIQIHSISNVVRKFYCKIYMFICPFKENGQELKQIVNTFENSLNQKEIKSASYIIPYIIHIRFYGCYTMTLKLNNIRPNMTLSSTMEY